MVLEKDNEMLLRSIKINLSKWIKLIDIAIKSEFHDKPNTELHTIKNEMMILRGDYDY